MALKPNDIKMIVQTALLAASAARDLFDFLTKKKLNKKLDLEDDAKSIEQRIIAIEESQLKGAQILKDSTEEIKEISIKVKSFSKYLKYCLILTIINSIVLLIVIIRAC
jgi:hypothetical protein